MRYRGLINRCCCCSMMLWRGRRHSWSRNLLRYRRRYRRCRRGRISCGHLRGSELSGGWVAGRVDRRGARSRVLGSHHGRHARHHRRHHRHSMHCRHSGNHGRDSMSVHCRRLRRGPCLLLEAGRCEPRLAGRRSTLVHVVVVTSLVPGTVPGHVTSFVAVVAGSAVGTTALATSPLTCILGTILCHVPCLVAVETLPRVALRPHTASPRSIIGLLVVRFRGIRRNAWRPCWRSTLLSWPQFVEADAVGLLA